MRPGRSTAHEDPASTGSLARKPDPIEALKSMSIADLQAKLGPRRISLHEKDGDQIASSLGPADARCR